VTNGYIEELVKKKLKVKSFEGVFPCNLLPHKLKRGASLIVNTDPSHLPGSHYVALYQTKEKLLYFDPLCMPQDHFSDLSENLKRRQMKTHPVLKKPVQDVESRFCSFFCVDFILSLTSPFSKAKVKTYKKSPNLMQNDAIVLKNLLLRIKSGCC